MILYYKHSISVKCLLSKGHDNLFLLSLIMWKVLLWEKLRKSHGASHMMWEKNKCNAGGLSDARWSLTEISRYTQDLGGNSTLFIAYDIMKFCILYVCMETFNIFLLWHILICSFMRFYCLCTNFLHYR